MKIFLHRGFAILERISRAADARLQSLARRAANNNFESSSKNSSTYIHRSEEISPRNKFREHNCKRDIGRAEDLIGICQYSAIQAASENARELSQNFIYTVAHLSAAPDNAWPSYKRLR